MDFEFVLKVVLILVIQMSVYIKPMSNIDHRYIIYSPYN